MKIETVILKNLTANESFARKVLPYLKAEYFPEPAERLLYEDIANHITRYNELPSKDVLAVQIGAKDNVSEAVFRDANNLLDEVTSQTIAPADLQWLLDQTQAFCQERALHNAVLDSIHIMNGEDKKRDKGMIPKLLSDALAVSFDPYVGHDYLEDADERYEFYHRVEERVPFDIALLNKITKGGLPKKTLNCLLAGINVGKSLTLCHVAAAALQQNFNVLYITLEMAQEQIAKRVDANLLNISIDVIEEIKEEDYDKKINRLKNNIKGKLIIKEYPTAAAGAHHFKALLNECKLKKRFVPDIIIIDYINICCSSRIKPGSNIGTYAYVKAIAEELRGLAVEADVPVLTATQLTRDGFSSSEPDMTDIAESFGLPATCDWIIALVALEDNDEQFMIKQIKSRYYNVTLDRKFVVGVDRARMRLFDIDEKKQNEYLSQSNQTPIKEGNNGKPAISDGDLAEVMGTIRDLHTKKHDIKL